MTQQTKPTAVLHDSHESDDKISAHVKVLDGTGEWAGDFWVDFEKRPRRSRRERYVADWGTIKSGGNGIYVDGTPCFWTVEEVADDLRDKYAGTGVKFETIDSGPNDR